MLFSVLVGLLLATASSAASRYESSRVSALDMALLQDVTLRENSLANYFERAEAVNLVLAQNPAFRDYYEGGLPDILGIRFDTGRARVPGEVAASLDPLALADVNGALAQLQTIFSGSIGEACFIDARGHENARVVDGVAADVDELSPDETGSSFFAPTFAARVGVVHQAKPYLSPDTNEWVISNSTPIEADGGRAAIVHFEVTLESFESSAERDAEHRTLVLDRQTGRTLFDTGVAGLEAARDDVGDPPLSVARTTSLPRISDHDGHRVAALRVMPTGAADNANDWIVAVSAPRNVGFGISFGFREALLSVLAIIVAGALLFRTRVMQRSLTAAATSDPLTGLPNRRHFMERAQRTLAPAEPSGVLMIDCNGFKEINDSFGHSAGDAVLVVVAERLRAVVRQDDLVARLGGDEFAVLARGDDVVLGRLAEQIQEQFTQPITVAGSRVVVSASIGIARSPEDGQHAVELLRHADMAMYHGKRHRKSIVRYDVDHDPNSTRRLALAVRLRQAVEAREVDVDFQPQIDLVTNGVVGIEALARWSDAELGKVEPSEFIPFAEDLGLIDALTQHVLERSLVAWRRIARPDLTVAINLSARLLVEGGLVDAVAAALVRNDVPADRVIFELTEGLLIGESEAELVALRDLRSLGVAISLDDFGTGHSSLSYLSRLPVDELKIDRSFLADLDEQASNRFILTSAVDLGRRLGLRVVAEGVETIEMRDVVRAAGCRVAQGWLYAPAMSCDALTEWIADHERLGVAFD